MPQLVRPIEAPRLRLRVLDEGDRGLLADLFASGEVTRHLAIDPLPDETAVRRFAEAFIRTSRRELRERGAGAMAIAMHGEEAAIGYCGLRPLPDRPRALELLYALSPPHWGRGLATEAAQAAVAWAFDALDIDEVIGLAAPLNLASRRVMVKLGMAYAGETDRYYGARLAFYRMDRAHWQSRRRAPEADYSAAIRGAPASSSH